MQRSCATVRKSPFRSRLRCETKIQSIQENKTEKQKMEHNMVQSTVQQKCGSESWSLLFKINRQTFPTRTQAAQNQSCAQNIKLIINSHNEKVLHQNQPCPNEQKCNCIKKEFCQLNGNCQVENIVYEATITCNEQIYGENIIAETTFKKRYNNHKRSFNLPMHKNDT